MKIITPDHRQDKNLGGYKTKILSNRVMKENSYAAEATEFIDCDLRMKEQPFENRAKKMAVSKNIYY